MRLAQRATETKTDAKAIIRNDSGGRRQTAHPPEIFIPSYLLFHRSRIEVGDVDDGTGTYRTEVIDFIHVHATQLGRSVGAAGHVAGSLEHADTLGLLVELGSCHLSASGVVVCNGGRCGNWRAWLDEAFPFTVEVLQRGDVRFPWLGVGWVPLNVVVTVVVFIGQSCIRVSELVDEHLLEGGVVAR